MILKQCCRNFCFKSCFPINFELRLIEPYSNKKVFNVRVKSYIAEKSSAFRQAKENTVRNGLTAIAMARQAALLLLTVHSYEIPIHAVNNDFYRQALDLDLRGKRDYTETILSAMGGIDKRRFSQFKLLLQLSDEALELY